MSNNYGEILSALRSKDGVIEPHPSCEFLKALDEPVNPGYRVP